MNLLRVSIVGRGTFAFEFGNAIECARILHKQPWKFNGSLLIFTRLEGDERTINITLNVASFWIQMHDLRFHNMSRTIGKKVGSKIGQVLEVDCPAGGVALGRGLRVCILIDVTKSLCRGTPLTVRGRRSIIIFRYEKLSNFCYICNKLDHIDRDCPQLYCTMERRGGERKEFGSWLRVDGQQFLTDADIEAIISSWWELYNRII